MIDRNDTRILEVLQRNCKTPLAEIAVKVGLSIQAVSERIRKLEARGVIRRYSAILDQAQLGRDVTAFIQVLLEHPRNDAAFLETVREIPEVLECHHVVGDFSYLLKVRTTSARALEELIATRLRAAEGVTRTVTAFVLSTSKEETALALAAVEKDGRGAALIGR